MASALIKPEGPKHIFDPYVNIASDTSLMAERQTFPSRAWLVNQVDYIELVGMFFFQCIKFFAKKNVLFGYVGEKKGELGFVVG
jgi:hypothetical protein